MTDDERAIRDWVESWMAASRAGDTATVLSLMTDDVIFQVPGGEPFGKEAFAAASRGKKSVTLYNKPVPLRQETYDPVHHTVTLIPRGVLNLSKPLQLSVGGPGLTDATGRPVDGKNNGQAGSAYLALLTRGGVQVQAAGRSVGISGASPRAFDHILSRRWIGSVHFRPARHPH